MEPDFTLLRSLRFRRLRLVNTDDMHHVHFTSYGFAAAAIPELAKVTKAGPGIEYAVAGSARLVLEFLDTELK